jgi:hypothetical protein
MMMRNIFAIALLVTLFASPAWAADFTATVESNDIAAGEGFSLQLSLTGTDAKSDPDIAALQQSFTVVSEGHTSNTSIINGSVKSSIGWDLTLISKKEGMVEIPAVSIDTDAGVLHTQPIALKVEGAVAQPGHVARGNNISVSAKAEQNNPYQNQPISYTATVTARATIADVAVGDINVDHAIIEKQGQPEMRDEVENGVPVKVIKLRFLITPLAAGKITIPPVTLQGQIENQEQPRAQTNNGMVDPFQMMQNMGGFGFRSFKPFSIASNAVELDVKPPAVAMDPWLPLHSLVIHEKMDTAQAKVGEPLTRKLVLMAEGAVGSQLPSLEAQQNHTDFKVYNDKPTMGNDVDKKTGIVSGWRGESFSLIPQKSGKLTLPAIKVAWWDIDNNKIAYAELPEKTIDVAPGAAAQTAPPPAAVPDASASPVPPSASTAATPRPYALYAIVAALAFVLLLVVFWAFSLQRKISRLNTPTAAARKQPAPAKPSGKIDMSQIKTAEELNRFIQTYAHEQWGTEKNASLEDIFAAVQKSRAGLSTDDAQAVAREISAALYAGRGIADMEGLKERSQKVLSSVQGKVRNPKESSEKLPGLNPS